LLLELDEAQIASVECRRPRVIEALDAIEHIRPEAAVATAWTPDRDTSGAQPCHM